MHQHLLTFKLLITDNILVTHRSDPVGRSSVIKQTRCCDDSGHRDGFVMMDQRKSVCLDNCLFIYIRLFLLAEQIRMKYIKYTPVAHCMRYLRDLYNELFAVTSNMYECVYGGWVLIS